MDTDHGQRCWREAWIDALDELELGVERAEQLLRSAEPGPAEPWVPPTVRGPMPDDLVPRARLLHERQLATAAQVATTAATTRQHLTLATRLRATTPAEVPVYLDVIA